MHLTTASVDELADSLDRGELTSGELVAACRKRIEDYNDHGPGLHAVRELDPSADEQAAKADRVRRNGGRGALLGLPVLVKDNIDVAGLATTAGSLALARWRRRADAAVVALLRRAGAVVLGKTNLTEWANFMAHGMPGGFSAAGGQVVNPYDPDATPSGSSSGSAVAVAAAFAPFALGTETIGSILSPAHACSVVGMRPTFGTIDRHGIVPLASSFDTIGPLAANVAGAAALLAVLRDRPRSSEVRRGALRDARVGFVAGPMPEGADALWDEALAALAALGATCRPVALDRGPVFREILEFEFRRDLDRYLAALPAESPVHSLADVVAFNDRFAADELTYGQAQLLACLALDVASPAVRARYETALLANRMLAARACETVFSEAQVGAVVFPAAEGAGFSSRAGLPAITIPIGYLNRGRRPVGVCLVGPAGSDDDLCSLAFDLEQALDARRPPPSLEVPPAC